MNSLIYQKSTQRVVVFLNQHCVIRVIGIIKKLKLSNKNIKDCKAKNVI